MMKKTSTRKRMRLRNDTGSLLRSRPLQALLVTVAAAQGVAGGSGKIDRADQPHTVRELAARVASAQPVGEISAVVVAAPVKLAKAQASRAKSPGTAAERKLAAAEEFARKYRQRGFKVSPSLARQIH